ncbi:MAG: hypothetical protein AAGA48_20380 [Myxococcota bacterium]
MNDIRGAIALISAVGLWLAPSAYAQDDAIDLTVPIDARKEANRATGATLKSLDKLANHSLVCVDIKVTVDGSQPAAILTSNEGDMRRYPVDCRKGQLGSFPMASGVEYYLPNIGKVGKAEVDLEVFPGTRTTHPFNDVNCVASSEGGKSATFHISGFYLVRSHNFGDRRVIELRPAANGDGVSRKAAAACLE